MLVVAFTRNTNVSYTMLYNAHFMLHDSAVCY